METKLRQKVEKRNLAYLRLNRFMYAPLAGRNFWRLSGGFRLSLGRQGGQRGALILTTRSTDVQPYFSLTAGRILGRGGQKWIESVLSIRGFDHWTGAIAGFLVVGRVVPPAPLLPIATGLRNGFVRRDRCGRRLCRHECHF